jgi:DegV family protein with EDD domain
MRLGLTVDSACDLPWSFLEQNNVFVLPISVRINGELVEDTRDPQQTLNFYRSGVLSKGHDVESVPYSTEQIRRLFLDKIVIDYDFAFIQTITKTRSPIYEHAYQAMHRILGEYRERRQGAGVSGPFSMRVVDSRTLFAGQGVIAAETMRLIKENVPRNELRTRVEVLTTQAYGYAVVPHLYYVRERGRKKGDSSVSFVGAVLGKALDIVPILCGHNGDTFPVAKARGFESAVQRLFAYAEQRIRRGLLAPYVCISYAGEEDIISQLPGFDQLARTARENNIKLLTSMMSTTGGANIGPGAVSLALIAEPHTFEDLEK